MGPVLLTDDDDDDDDDKHIKTSFSWTLLVAYSRVK
jgi:hypothetical protein